MLADNFTKPLQGALFWKIWNVIMGRKHVNTLQHHEHDKFTIKEHVDNQNSRKMSKNLSSDAPQNTDQRKNSISYRDAVLCRLDGGREKIKNKNEHQLIIYNQSSLLTSLYFF